MADEKTIGLRKETGGATLTGPDGKEYAWKKDGDTVQVPYSWALDLLAIDGGGFEVADEKRAAKAAEKADAEAATEPPEDEHREGDTGLAVTEPAPLPAPGAESRVVPAPDPGPDGPATDAAKAGNKASPVTPAGRAATSTRPAAGKK